MNEVYNRKARFAGNRPLGLFRIKLGFFYLLQPKHLRHRSWCHALHLGLESRLVTAHWAQTMQLITSHYQPPTVFRAFPPSHNSINHRTITNHKLWNTAQYFPHKFSEEEDKIVKFIGSHTTLHSPLKKNMVKLM